MELLRDFVSNRGASNLVLQRKQTHTGVSKGPLVRSISSEDQLGPQASSLYSVLWFLHGSTKHTSNYVQKYLSHSQAQKWRLGVTSVWIPPTIRIAMHAM